MWDAKSKNVAIDSFVEKYDIDLSQSYAYGDTNGDINMLKRVGNPIAINPTNELLNHMIEDKSLHDKAQIIVERKDIVYSLDCNVERFDIGL
ncbi:HAD hydrolase family protein [Clostridium perfringens]|uniref:HAD hydrolase family protein n=1 Tax=Clostridium perfringens TaxID=1502 RepID=UPI0038FD0D95